MVIAFSYSKGATTVIPNVLSDKRSSYNTNVSLSDVQEPITNAPPEVRRVIERVLQAEKDKLYMRIPRNINDDILKIIKEEVQ
jgi:regulator of protease activity HflC (stomatin/prohibitin superfamily)